MPESGDLEEIVYTALPAQGSYRIPTSHVLPGMFIADLDRPWTDTPFPGGGFVVTGDAQVEALRSYCRAVWVDPDFSNPSLSRAIRAAAVLVSDAPAEPSLNATLAYIEGSRPTHPRLLPANPAVGPGPAVDARATPPMRADVRISVAARARFRQLVTSGATSIASDSKRSKNPLVRLGGWLARTAPLAAGRRPDHGSRLGMLALRYEANIGSTEYPARLPFQQVLPFARASHSKGLALMHGLYGDIRAGRPLVLAPLAEAAAELSSCAADNPETLLWLCKVREEELIAGGPAMTVASLMMLFGRHLGMTREQLVELALIGLLADIGKVLLPRELIEYPGMLGPREFEFVKDHVRIGLEMLSTSPELSEAVLLGIVQHHERLDGSGYPKGLHGDSIGPYGRMAGIVDCYAALVSARPYANSVAPETALAGLHGWGDSQFCAQLVEEFTFALGIFPIGSLVQLMSGEVAAVVDRDPLTGAQPKLLVMTGPDKGPLRSIKDREGERSPDDVYNGARVRIALGLPTGAFGLKLRDYFLQPPR